MLRYYNIVFGVKKKLKKKEIIKYYVINNK